MLQSWQVLLYLDQLPILLASDCTKEAEISAPSQIIDKPIEKDVQRLSPIGKPIGKDRSNKFKEDQRLKGFEAQQRHKRESEERRLKEDFREEHLLKNEFEEKGANKDIPPLQIKKSLVKKFWLHLLLILSGSLFWMGCDLEPHVWVRPANKNRVERTLSPRRYQYRIRFSSPHERNTLENRVDNYL